MGGNRDSRVAGSALELAGSSISARRNPDIKDLKRGFAPVWIGATNGGSNAHLARIHLDRVRALSLCLVDIPRYRIPSQLLLSRLPVQNKDLFFRQDDLEENQIEDILVQAHFHLQPVEFAKTPRDVKNKIYD